MIKWYKIQSIVSLYVYDIQCKYFVHPSKLKLFSKQKDNFWYKFEHTLFEPEKTTKAVTNVERTVVVTD